MKTRPGKDIPRLRDTYLARGRARKVNLAGGRAGKGEKRQDRGKGDFRPSLYSLDGVADRKERDG